MRIRVLALFGLTSICVASLTAQSCDPERATTDFFRKQGLNLLKPARDYVKIGGLVAKRGNNAMEYIDPLDAVAAVNGSQAFRGAILGEAEKKTGKFGAVVSAIKSVLPNVLDLSAESNQEVKLDQINTSGMRLSDTGAKSLIGKPNTNAELTTDLNDGLRMFVVQEVYSAESFQISSADRSALSVKLGGNSAVQNCVAAANPTSEAAAKPAGTAVAGTTPPAVQPSGQPQAAAEKPSVGFGMCRSVDYTLSFKADKPGSFMPFAVRLKEVEIKDHKVTLKLGTVTPAGTLGPNAQKFALVDETAPIIAGLQRRPRR